MNAIKKLVFICFTCCILFAHEKSSAFFAIGGSYMPKLAYEFHADKPTAPLYGAGVKYGAKYYFNNALGLRLYIPIQAGYAHFGKTYNPSNTSFVSAGMGGDILLDLGSSKSSIGLFSGGEVHYAYYWLGESNPAGVQTQVHAGLALNLNPSFAINMGIKRFINRPEHRHSSLRDSLSKYGVFVDFLFMLDNSQISSQQVRNQQLKEQRRAQRMEEERQRLRNSQSIYFTRDPVYSTNNNGSLGAFFGGLVGASFGSGIFRSQAPSNPQPAPSAPILKAP